MSVFQVSGATLTLLGDGNVNAGNIALADSINPVTGSIGVSTVRIVNTSTANLAVVTWTPQDTVYTFEDVAYTTTSADGVDAVFNVTATVTGYEVTLVDGGVDFIVLDDITVAGTAIGGATPANDIVVVIQAVSNTGAITSFTTTGTAAWPQSDVSALTVLPMVEDFVQVTVTPAIGVYFTGNCADGNILITPVNTK
jgi:hypothetical protein